MQEIATCKVIALLKAVLKLTSLKPKAEIRKALIIMKLTGILILSACLHVGANGVSQTVTLSEKNVPLIKIIQEIEKQTDYVFFYKVNWLDKAQRVTIAVDNYPVTQVLDVCFKNQPLSYSILGKIITIGPKNEQLKKKELAPIDISGRISDEDGNPLSGANVKIKGAMIGTTTNADGAFLLKGVDENAELEISYVGFQTVIISLKHKSTIVISLRRIETSLQEVVINKGYYTESRRLSTGNVGKVTAKDIEKQPISNPLLALQGRVAGLFIIQQNGIPGGGVQVRIQGQNSLTNGNAPLYIVDGVPFPTEIPTAGTNFGPLGFSGEKTIRQGVIGTGNALSFINPSDIESIEVLKDADATAIYGSRAANGAILITTKRGKAGKSKLDINFQQGWGKVTRTMDMLNTRQYLDMRYEALRNDGLIPSANPAATAPFTYAPDLTIWDTTRYTDWKKILIGGSAEYTNFNASITGGTSAAQYRIGGTYQRETSVFPGNYSDEKGSMHFNLNNSASDRKIKFNLSANYTIDNNQLPNTDLTAYAHSLAPNAPELFNGDGSLNWAPNSLGTSTWTNPMAETLYKTYEAKTNSLIANTSLSYQILRNLELSGNLGYTNIYTKDYQLNALLGEKPERWPTSLRTANYGNRNVNTWIIEPQARYKLILGNSKFDLLAGATFQQTLVDVGYIQGAGYNNDQVLKNPAAATIVGSAGQLNTLYKYNAFFGRFNYNLKNKYIVNLTGRRDGSSRFGESNKFHNFGSIGAAWIFTEEKFFKKISFLSFGKFKASYGTTGSDQIGDYVFLSLYNTVNVPISYQGTSGLTPGDIQNPYVEWEETRKLNTGIDLGFFSDRIVLGANYAFNRSSNQLLTYRLPNITGRTSVVRNFPAIVQNTNWEFSVTSINFKRNQINWTSNINVTIPRNKLVDFPNLESSSYASIYIVGEPVNVQKVYHFLGVDPGTGLYLVADKNGNPTSSPNSSTDRTVLVSAFSKYYGGFQNSLQYKGFQLDILFQFVKQAGGSRIFSNGTTAPGWFAASTGEGNQPAFITLQNHWQKPGDVALVQRYTTNTSLSSKLSSATNSDANFRDATFARLKNLSLSWQVPSGWNRRVKMQNATFYLQAQNLLTITKYKGLDPENQNFSSLPPLRMITIGLKAVL